MKTKQMFYGLLMAGALLVGVCGCSKGDKKDLEPEVEKPTIGNLVIGQGNSKTVKVGDVLLIEADIIARGKISRVLINVSSLDAPVPVTISSTFEGDLKDKTNAHLKWDTLMSDVPTGRYRLTITVEAKVGEYGRVTSDFTVLP